jgi:Raf kinase inhibitor-like YbhB/YbcL family protein
LNDYTGWFAGDADMRGEYLGYDGPCPPWNDALVHHYHFRLYALDVEHLKLADGFTVTELRAAMDGHVLAEAELMGTYTLNSALT